jgi:site-specific DNA-methyltransferase (adenine-specific)
MTTGIDESKIFTLNPTEIQVKDELPRIRKELGEIDKLAESIKKFGQLQPVVINHNNELIAGGRRLAACMIADLPVRVCYVDAVDHMLMREMELEENVQRKALTVGEALLAEAELHNFKQELHGEALPGVTKEGEKQGWGVADTAALLGKSKASVAEDLVLAAALKIMPELGKLETKNEIKSVLKNMEKVSQQMDGLLKYEATIKEAKEFVIVNRPMEGHIAGMANGSIDTILTDPPYGLDIFEVAMGIAGQTGGDNISAGVKYDDSEDYAKSLLKELAVQSYRITKSTGHIYCFCAPSHFWWLKETMNAAGWITRERPIIWIKRESGQCNQPSMWPSSAYEFILFARKPESRLVTEGKPDWIQCEPVLPSVKTHQAEKPILLLKELLTRTNHPGAYIYDPFAGSGSTIEAACDLKMHVMGCEKAIESYASMVTRMQTWLEKRNV